MRPKISEKEFEERWKKTQSFMEMRDIDLLIAYADDRTVYGQAYARWLVNYQPQFEAAWVLIGQKGAPVVVTGAESVEFVKSTSFCSKVYAAWEFLHPDEEYPYCEVSNMEEIIGNMENMLGRKIIHVGLAGSEFIPYQMMKLVYKFFDEKNVEDVSSELSMMRAVKTGNELEVIRYAYQIAGEGMKAVRKNIRKGITERELAAEAEYVMRKMGSEGMGIETMIASGAEHTSPILARTTFRGLKDGDLVVATLAPRYEGYHGAIARPYFLGTVSDEIKKAYELVVYSQRKTAEFLGPGISAKEADTVARKYINEAGLGNHFTYCGIHSTGVIEFEAPILSSKSDLILQENMVFSIDIPLFLTEWGGMRFENGYVITKTGTEPLNSYDDI